MDRLFRFFAIAECRVHDAKSFQCPRRPVSCLQPEYSGLLMSCQTVDWVSRGVVSSGFCRVAFLTVSEHGFGFVVSGGGQGLQLFAPRLGQYQIVIFVKKSRGFCGFLVQDVQGQWDMPHLITIPV